MSAAPEGACGYEPVALHHPNVPVEKPPERDLGGGPKRQADQKKQASRDGDGLIQPFDTVDVFQDDCPKEAAPGEHNQDGSENESAGAAGRGASMGKDLRCRRSEKPAGQPQDTWPGCERALRPDCQEQQCKKSERLLRSVTKRV